MLLLGRGGHQGAAGEGMESLAEALRATTGRYMTVHTAVAERGLVSLPEGLEACARAGGRRILVIPVFFGRDRSLVHWLSKAACRWARGRDGTDTEVVFARAIGEHPALGEAVIRAVADAEGEVPTRVEDFQSLEDPPAWSEIPPQERHVLACMGPRCTSRGPGRLYIHFHKRLRDRGLWGRSGVQRGPDRLPLPLQPGPDYDRLPGGRLVLRADHRGHGPHSGRAPRGRQGGRGVRPGAGAPRAAGRGVVESPRDGRGSRRYFCPAVRRLGPRLDAGHSGQGKD